MEHSEFVAHSKHKFDVQTGVSVGQSPVVVHCMHILLSHVQSVRQSLSALHSTQADLSVLQVGVAP